MDRGYRGAKVKDGITVHIVGAKRKKKMKRSLRKWMKRRAAIEPIIGHMKNNDRGMRRNHLLTQEGDKMYAVLIGAGFNMRKLLKAFSIAFSMLKFIPQYLTDFSLKKKSG